MMLQAIHMLLFVESVQDKEKHEHITLLGLYSWFWKGLTNSSFKVTLFVLYLVIDRTNIFNTVQVLKVVIYFLYPFR